MVRIELNINTIFIHLRQNPPFETIIPTVFNVSASKIISHFKDNLTLQG
jgi:hypothetical protein